MARQETLRSEVGNRLNPFGPSYSSPNKVSAALKIRGRVLRDPEAKFLLLYDLLHVVMVMMLHHVMVMMLHYVMVVMLHRSGLSGHRSGRDASGERNGEQDLLQHSRTLGLETAPHQRGMGRFCQNPHEPNMNRNVQLCRGVTIAAKCLSSPA